MFSPLVTFLAQTEPAAGRGLLGMVGWALLLAIVVAFVTFGLRDLARLSWARISAISSVSFDESIRRRVLWITPLAILGAIVVSQLQNAVDAQDAIRQSTKICLFATGLVVTLVAIILASTNLQREIETRVIYTIVTKPTTRLEIVLGKLWGFAKVSAAILLIMGVFTYAFLHVQSWRLRSGIATTLHQLPPDAVNRQTLEFYRDAGLLNARAMIQPASMQLMAAPPTTGQPRLIAGGQGQKLQVQFKFAEDDYATVAEAIKRGARLAFVIDLASTVRQPTETEWETIRLTQIPTTGGPPPAAEGPSTGPSTAPATAPAAAAPTTAPTGLPIPTVSVYIHAANGDSLVAPDQLSKWLAIPLVNNSAAVPIPPEVLDRMFGDRDRPFTVSVDGHSPAVTYAVTEKPVAIRIIEADGSVKPSPFEPLPETVPPVITGTVGRYGQQLYGGAEGYGGVAVFRFDGAKLPAGGGDTVTFEIKAGVERGADTADEHETLLTAELRVRDPNTGATSEPVTFRPETNRISYVPVPRSALPAGEFDALVRVRTPDQWLGVLPSSVSLASGSRSFAFNLVKSLLILWLMSVLVVSIALFCSTFVSWPIAVVLTLVILLGRWGVDQIGDVGGAEFGARMTGQTENAIAARIERESINALSKVLTAVSAFLPDISSFQATADIERGISVPPARFASAGWVLLGYGLPMVILAYLILKRKEVAP